MGERDPNKPQLDFPALVSDILTQLQVRGQIGLLDLDASVQPVYVAAARQGVSLGTLTTPAFLPAGIFHVLSPAPVGASTVGADTGQLPAGTYDIWAEISGGDLSVGSANRSITFQHRNAANSASLANLAQITVPQTPDRGPQQLVMPLFAYTIEENERFRWQTTGVALAANAFFQSTIWVQRRAVP